MKTLDQIIRNFEKRRYATRWEFIKDLVKFQEDVADLLNEVIHPDDETTEPVLKLRNMIDESI